MKKFLLLFIFISGFALSQMPDISEVQKNNNRFYKGTICDYKTPIKVKIILASKDRNNDQEYFISGQSIVENNSSNFEGKFFGEYDLLEEPNGKHTGIFIGKFIYTFRWNRKTQKVEHQFVQFAGNWMSYDHTLNFKTNWNNNE